MTQENVSTPVKVCVVPRPASVALAAGNVYVWAEVAENVYPAYAGAVVTPPESSGWPAATLGEPREHVARPEVVEVSHGT